MQESYFEGSGGGGLSESQILTLIEGLNLAGKPAQNLNVLASDDNSNLIQAPLTTGKVWVGVGDIPTEKDYYKIQYFDATVGTGGDYATITLAISANKYRLKLLSDIVNTFSLSTYVLIDCNNYSITGNITNNYDYQRLNNLKLIGNFVNNADYCVFSDIRCGKITNTNGAIRNVFDNIQYTGTATDSDATTRKWDVYKN